MAGWGNHLYGVCAHEFQFFALAGAQGIRMEGTGCNASIGQILKGFKYQTKMFEFIAQAYQIIEPF